MAQKMDTTIFLEEDAIKEADKTGNKMILLEPRALF